ncbi:NO-inducible flavohemoprotein [Alkalicoccobacillus gibsonii]|uniref:NO-inducible flavohemoprotein n=1 Tax=Alkalicoccobacillus gibsonii TaxID=79881 RepID=UPI003F7B7DF2
MAKALTKEQMSLIKSSAPVLAEYGTTITKCFYSNLFNAHPELLHLFNHSNQKQTKQQQALANTLYAAAANIEQLESLLPVVRQIAQKHRSLQVKPEHYPIVGHHLLAAIKEVLGNDASDELIEAWEVAYGIIAEIFISVEKEMYQEVQEQEGGWSGYRRFTVKKKKPETSLVTSFYLVPEDGQTIPSFVPGQYITIKGYSQDEDDEYTHLRQYSLSDAPNQEYFRLSIKRDGTVSTYMHQQVEEGATVELTAPAGEFVTDLDGDDELVLISAGIGITPLMSMAKGALRTKRTRSIHFLHATTHKEAHVFFNEVEQLEETYSSFKRDVFYSEEDSRRITTEDINQAVRPNQKQQFYICGPEAFIQDISEALREAGVSNDHVHVEVFTPRIPV